MTRRASYAFGALTLALVATIPVVWGALRNPVVEIRSTQSTETAARGEPQLVAELTRHEFGEMEVGTQGEHAFTIRNAGVADLELWAGKTTCTCTLSDLDDGKLRPGAESRVWLRWTPPKPTDLFAQGATIKTNDPKQPAVYFSVVGAVRRHLAVAPESILFSDVPVGESAMKQFVVYSQAWESMEIVADCSEPHLALDVQPADEATLAEHKAKSASVVRVALAPGLKPGQFQAAVNLTVKRGASAEGSALETRQLSFPVSGVIAPSIWLEGPNLLDDDVLTLGTIPLGQGKVRSTALFVRGEPNDVQIDVVQVRPEFLKVRIGARQQVSKNLAKYQIEVEVPPDAPPAACVGARAGEIRLQTDHPQMLKRQVKVDFAVLQAP